MGPRTQLRCWGGGFAAPEREESVSVAWVRTWRDDAERRRVRVRWCGGPGGVRVWIRGGGRERMQAAELDACDVHGASGYCAGRCDGGGERVWRRTIEQGRDAVRVRGRGDDPCRSTIERPRRRRARSEGDWRPFQSGAGVELCFWGACHHSRGAPVLERGRMRQTSAHGGYVHCFDAGRRW